MQRTTWVGIASLGLAGCATVVDVQPLATGRGDVAAYELNGSDLVAVQREALRLCPQGGDIVRQAVRSQTPEHLEGRWRGWMNSASAWVEPPQRGAQLQVVCRGGGSPMLIAPAAGPTASAGPAAAGVALAGDTTQAVVAPPIGPLSVEW